MFSITNNIGAQQSSWRLDQANRMITNSVRRLSSGLAVEYASDDPAKLVGSVHVKSDLEKLYAQGNGYQREYLAYAYEDSMRGITSDLLQGLQSAYSTLANTTALSQDQRDAYQLQIDKIIEAIGRVGTNTVLAGKQVFYDESDGVNALDAEQLARTLDTQSGETYTLADLKTGGALEGSASEVGQKLITQAINANSSARGVIAAEMKGLESLGNVNAVTVENMQDLLSRMVDADYAEEISTLVRAQTMQQGQLAARAIANQQHQNVLALLSA